MTPDGARWADLFPPGARVLLIVNSASSQLDEIDRTVTALERSAGLATVSAIAPAALRPWLIHRGIDAARVLPPRLAGLDIEFDHFLERGPAIRWAIRQRADLVLGSEPYTPNNEDVKPIFERRVAAMLGDGVFVVHSLPAEQVFLLSAEDLWRRAARPEAMERHRARVHGAIERLHAAWASRTQPSSSLTAELLSRDSEDRAGKSPLFVDARHYAFEGLNAAVLAEDLLTPAASLRVVIDPPGAAPGSGWLADRLRPMGKPEYAASGLRWHGTRLIARGNVGGPYAYLLKSRPLTLKRGDTVLAEGRVYRGGVSIGLEGKDGKWASRADVDEPGRFLAAAIAKEPGTYALVVANYLKGEDHRAGLVVHRFGWARTRG